MKRLDVLWIALGIMGAVVGCAEDDGPDTATMVVEIATMGDDPDPDGYLLTIEGRGDTAVATFDTLTLATPPGFYHLVHLGSEEVPIEPDVTLSLGGVAANCGNTSGTTLRQELEAGATDTLRYTVHCAAIAATPR